MIMELVCTVIVDDVVDPVMAGEVATAECGSEEHLKYTHLSCTPDIAIVTGKSRNLDLQI